QMSERLPRTSRTINAVESSGNLVEKDLCLLAAAVQHALEIDLVAVVFRQFLRAADGELDEIGGCTGALRVQLVERPFAVAPRLHKFRILQQAEMRGNARLTKPR